MDRDEEVSLNRPCLGHALMQRNEEIVIAGQHRAHQRIGVYLRLEPLGDGQRDVLFVSARAADCSGVFAAVAGVDCDRDQAGDLAFGAARMLGGRFRFSGRRSLAWEGSSGREAEGSGGRWVCAVGGRA